MTFFAASIVTVQVPEVLLHAPLHPLKEDLDSGTAMRVTEVPSSYILLQLSLPQSIPAGVEVIAPLPVPDFVAVRVKAVRFDIVPTSFMPLPNAASASYSVAATGNFTDFPIAPVGAL